MFPQSFRFQGKTFPVLHRWRIGDCEYLVFRRLANRITERYLALDHRAGSGSAFCVVHVLPRSRSAIQQLEVLHRISQWNRNLPKLLRFQRERDVIRVVTEWVPGDDLALYLDLARDGKRAWPSPVETFQRFHGLAHGLAQLHCAANVIHGDVKPANLIFTATSRQWVLIDYGSAWPVERTAQRYAGDGFSPGYSAPELQTTGDLSDFRSDQFSATVVHYELLTGELPYGQLGGDAGLSPHRAKLEAAYVPPSRCCRESRFVPKRVWDQLDAVVARGLSLDPNQRFASDTEWLSALQQVKLAMQLPETATAPLDRRLSRLLDWTERVWPWKSSDRPRSENR
jgi:serine/threonine protein kinase